MATITNQQLGVYDKLLEALGEVDRPGAVCTSGDRPLTMPGLEVKGVGALSLPLGKTQARKLIKQCRQAPYGKGTETLVDTDVRQTWELDLDDFQLTNPKWEDLVEEIVTDVQRELGLEKRKLTPHLYKLLVYEKGGFFLPHRDGEKLDRMVATLVICLPSVCEGGELIVSHDGWQCEILFTGAASGHELSYAAFYADCQHEVRPLRSGYRLCLTYNLTLAKSRSKKGISAPSYSAAASAISALLDDWREAEDKDKIAITLDHRYTQDGLSVDKLKGVDRARAEVLFEAAEQADCVAHLALVTLWQSGAAEGGYDEYSYRGGYRGYYRSDVEDEDDYDETGGDYEMGEIYDHSLSANHWSDHQGKKVRFGEIHLDEVDIVSEAPLDDGDPNSEDFEGFTGNAGMTLESPAH
ncbi:MAG: 2OG-Fe(II) oxygenase [Halobacteria archaeon]|nr:2OG-Fe(II) oxygenase [Halobacteria archaeon]